MTLPPASAVESDVRSLARRALCTGIARRSAQVRLTQNASAFRTRSTHLEALWLATETRLERDIDLDSPTYFRSRITIRVNDAPGMYRWRKRLFVAIARNATSPAEYFRLPHERPIAMAWRVRL
jgi:K+ transporter